MNANRNHANRPTGLTAVDRARQAAALAKHDAQVRAERRAEHIKAFATVALVVGLAVVFFIRITSGA